MTISVPAGCYRVYGGLFISLVANSPVTLMAINGAGPGPPTCGGGGTVIDARAGWIRVDACDVLFHGRNVRCHADRRAFVQRTPRLHRRRRREQGTSDSRRRPCDGQCRRAWRRSDDAGDWCVGWEWGGRGWRFQRRGGTVDRDGLRDRRQRGRHRRRRCRRPRQRRRFRRRWAVPVAGSTTTAGRWR